MNLQSDLRKSLGLIVPLLLTFSCMSRAQTQKGHTHDLVITDTISYATSRCEFDKGLNAEDQKFQDSQGFAAFSLRLLGGVIENNRVKIRVSAVGAKCEKVDVPANNQNQVSVNGHYWINVLIDNLLTVRPVLRTTSEKFSGVTWTSRTEFLYDDKVENFFNERDLADFLSGRELGIRKFDLLFIMQNSDGSRKDNQFPASRSYFYELVRTANGSVQIRMTNRQK